MRTITTSTNPSCPHCQSAAVIKNGHRPHQDGSQRQNYRCKTCGKQFNERISTPLYRLQTPLSTLTIALKMRSEGMGIRASGKVLGKSHSNIIRMRHSDDIALPIAVTRTSMPRQPMGYDEP